MLDLLIFKPLMAPRWPAKRKCLGWGGGHVRTESGGRKSREHASSVRGCTSVGGGRHGWGVFVVGVFKGGGSREGVHLCTGWGLL